ncbi:MAG: hypothetical protein R2825_19590 [Saprospiraceae bacterium]
MYKSKKYIIPCKGKAHKPDGLLFFAGLQVAACGVGEEDRHKAICQFCDTDFGGWMVKMAGNTTLLP